MSMTLHQGVLHKYTNPVFIETGSYLGGGIEAASAESAFQEIYSIEIDPKYYTHCQNYAGCRDKRVVLILGDSSVELPKLLAKIKQRCTFWLDAHFTGEVLPEGVVNCPALKELEAIKQHPIKNHTIMIDDRFTFGTPAFDGIEETQLHAKLREINPNYRFVYEDGAFKNSVIVAVLP